ncbi:MAG: hypothetical protein ACI9FG_001541 [Crocinitomicaceae bacterium]|jgi:hypothetical protein
MKEKYNLDSLRDLAVPEAPSWWPMAPGLVFLLVLVLWSALCFSVAFYQKYKAAAYRRAGVSLLVNVKTVRELSVLLKRVALVSFERESVASLYGKEWVEFLQQSCAGVKLDALASIDGAELSNSLRIQAKLWIKEHKKC